MSQLSTLQVSTFSVSEDAGKFIITAQVMVDTLIPKDMLVKDIYRLKGKEVRVAAFSGEHQVPELEPSAVVGEVLEVYWDDKVDAPFAKAEIFGDTEEELQLRKDLLSDQKLPVEQRKYKGVSIGIVNYTKKRHFYPRELTITSSPACDPCSISNVRQYNMSAPPTDNSKLVEYFSSTILKDKETIIAKLSGELDKVTKEFSGVTELLKTKLAEKDATIADFSKKVEAFNGVIAVKDKEIETFKEGMRTAQIAPLVETILYALSYPKDSELYKTEKEALMKRPQADLAAELTRQKRIMELHGQVLPTVGPNPGSPAAQAYSQNANGELVMDFKKAQGIM
jgi:hypothetical protein